MFFFKITSDAFLKHYYCWHLCKKDQKYGKSYIHHMFTKEIPEIWEHISSTNLAGNKMSQTGCTLHSLKVSLSETSEITTQRLWHMQSIDSEG